MKITRDGTAFILFSLSLKIKKKKNFFFFLNKKTPLEIKDNAEVKTGPQKDHKHPIVLRPKAELAFYLYLEKFAEYFLALAALLRRLHDLTDPRRAAGMRPAQLMLTG